MSNISITPSDLSSLISRMRTWSSQINSLRSSLRQGASSLGSSWKDPQYASFIHQVASMARQMELNAKELEESAKTLQVFKENLERTLQENARRMRR